MAKKINKSAVDGKIVSKAAVKKSPNTTYTQTTKSTKKKS